MGQIWPAGNGFPTSALNYHQINLLWLLDWMIPTLEFSAFYTSAKPQLLHISCETSFRRHLDYFSLEKSNTAQLWIQRVCCFPCPNSATFRLSLLFITTVSPSGTQRHHSCEPQNKHDGCEFALCTSKELMLIADHSLLIGRIVAVSLTTFWPLKQWRYL